MLDGSGIAQGVLRRETKAIARAISLIENGTRDAADLLRRLIPHTGEAFIVGITGPPGAGKSTLVDRIAGEFRASGTRVGIIAVDPTSPFSGGALLGDRIRMQSLTCDAGTFIRSMATRGSLGGLSHSVPETIQILDAAGFQVVLVETVGVGQAEVDIARSADATLLVLVPGLGDEVQVLKAGIMEIGDIFVLNKSDRAGASELHRQIEFFLGQSHRQDGWAPPLVDTVAVEGRGIKDIMENLRRYQNFYMQSEARQLKRKAVVHQRLLEVLKEELLTRLLEEREIQDRLERWVEKIVNREVDVHTAIKAIMSGHAESGEGRCD